VLLPLRSLRFEDKPDYSFLRRMFRDLFAKEGEHQQQQHSSPLGCSSAAHHWLLFTAAQ
jgi:hypothetical protein